MFKFENMDLIFIDESVKGSSNECNNHMKILYEHMLKYKYVKNKQLSGWIGSILDSCNQIRRIAGGNTNIKNHIDAERNNNFRVGLEKASEPNPTVKFPKSINDANSDNGNWFMFDANTIINNPNFIKDFLIKNKSGSDSIDKALEHQFEISEYFRGK